jgi:hypothetical protein
LLRSKFFIVILFRLLGYLLAKLQYTCHELDSKENYKIFKENISPNDIGSGSSTTKEDSDISLKTTESKTNYDGYLFIDPNNTVRKKSARILEKLSEAFPQVIYSSIIDLLEQEYLATAWYKKYELLYYYIYLL